MGLETLRVNTFRNVLNEIKKLRIVIICLFLLSLTAIYLSWSPFDFINNKINHVIFAKLASNSSQIQDSLYFVPDMRIADTRCTTTMPPLYCSSIAQVNASLHPLAANTGELVTVTGIDGVPTYGVASVLINITAENPQSWGWLAAYPAGASQSGVSNVNWIKGQPAQANLAVVPVGNSGQIEIYNGALQGTTNFQIDLEGYFAQQTSEAGLLYKINPTRIVDTRCSLYFSSFCSQLPSQNANLVAIAPKNYEAATVTGIAGVPQGSSEAVVLNVTVVNPTSGGFLTVETAPNTSPTTSSLNWQSSQTVAARVVAQVGSSNLLYFYNGSSSPLNIVIDLDGWFSSSVAAFNGGLSYQQVTPFRLFDTRCYNNSTSLTCSQIPAVNATLKTFTSSLTQIVSGASVSSVAANAQALVLNLTATDTTQWSYFTAYPSGSLPWASDLNWQANQTIANLTFVNLASGGTFELYNGSGLADAIGDVFGYLDSAPPIITSVSPAYGSYSGGNQVTINGLNLESNGQTPQVYFGSTASTSVSCSSATSCTAVAPGGTSTVSITLKTQFGTSNGISYQYVSLPSVNSISPSSGLVSGGTSVTITGSNFEFVSAVNFGSQPASNYTIVSPTEITAVSPQISDPQTVDITVTNVAGTSALSSADKYTYLLPPPQLQSISPDNGPVSGGNTVTLTGTNFYTSSNSTQVYFGSTASFSVNCTSSTTCNVVVPSGSGTVTVTVVTPGGSSNGLNFTYYAAYISNISPISPGVMQTLTINGSGFGSNQGSGYVKLYDTNTGVSWGAPDNDAYFEILSWSNNQIQVQVPADSGWWANAHWEPNVNDVLEVSVTNSVGDASNVVSFTLGQPVSYTYTVTNSSGANERLGPATFYSQVGTLAYNTTVDIVCQGTGQAIADSYSPSGTSDIWDLLSNGYWISDTLVNTPGVNEFSSGIPQCSGFVKNPYSDNSAGFDINQFSTTPASGCSTSTLPNRPYAPNIVQADGSPDANFNGCLSTEASWDTNYQGNGYPPLEVVMFPGAGHDTTGPAQCNGNEECNHGYNVAQATYNQVKSILGNLTPQIWLLDVECGGGSGWYGCSGSAASSYTDNIEALEGTMYFFIYHSLYVGIYSSPYEWSTITNNYSTVTSNSAFFVAGNWLADYGSNSSPYPTSCNGSSANSYLGNSNGAQPFSGGPLWMWQYADNVVSGSATFDGDLSCYQG